MQIFYKIPVIELFNNFIITTLIMPVDTLKALIDLSFIKF